MDTTIEQQVAMDEALVPHAQRLRIDRRNFRLLSDIKSKESSLQLVYDVLCICPFFKAFLVTADVPKIYMQEFWATTIVHHHAIQFKMDNKKHIVNLESFRDMLHICPRVHGQSFAKPSFKEEILAISCFLGHSQLSGRSLMNSKAYKEYYAVATGEAAPKPKAIIQKMRSSSDTSITPPTTAAGPRLTTSAKGKQPAKATKAKSLSALSKVAMMEAQQLKLVTKRSLQQTHIPHASGSGADEGTCSKPGVLDVPTDESKEELSWNSTDDEGNDNEKRMMTVMKRMMVKKEMVMMIKTMMEKKYDEGEYDKETMDEESFDPISQIPENSEDEGDGEEDIGLNVGEEERHVEEEDELYRDVNINQERGIQATLEVEDSHVTLTPVNSDGQQQSSSVSSQFVPSMLNPTLDVGMESIFETTSQMDVQPPTSVAPLPITAPTMTSSTIATTTTTISQAPILPTTAPSTILQNLLDFGSLFGFDNKLRTLEANFFEFTQTNQFARVVSAIFGILQRYMDQRMNEAVKVAVQIHSNRLRDEAQRENDEFLKSTAYAVAADLSEMELKKILTEKMEGNKSIQHLDEQTNLYKALVEAYESDKIILDTYGDTVTMKRRRDDDADKDEEPSARPNQGSKRRRKGKEPDSASAPSETATRSAGRSTKGSRSRQASVSESVLAEEPVKTTFQMDKPSHPEFDTGADDQPIESGREVYSKKRIIAVTELKIVEWHSYKHLDWITVRRDDDKLYKFKEGDFKRLCIQDIKDMLLLHVQGKLTNLTVEERFAFNVTPQPGSCKSLIELEYHLEEVYKATTDQLDWVNPEGQQYPHNLLQPLLLIPDNRADLSEMELKKILIEKMEGNKSIQRSDEQRNLYKALRRRDNDDDQGEGPSTGSDWGSKRQREGKEPESASTPLEPATKSAGRSTTGSKSRQALASESAFAEEPVQTTSQIEEPSNPVFETDLASCSRNTQTWISELAKQADSHSSFNELLDTPLDFSNFIMNRLRVNTLTPELLARPTYELMKGSCNSLTELEYHLEEVYKATTDQLDWEPINYDKHALWGVSHWGRKCQQFYGFAINRESALDVYSKWRIISVTDLKNLEWHNYKHLDWILVRRDDDKIYKLKEGDFKRLRLQDIEDMLLLLVQGKLSNLTVEERFAFNVSLRMFTMSIVIQRRVEDPQLGVKSYQKRLNLTKPDTY
nr:hypothetical protein [Tanacetum cinerariifolium]